MPLLTNYIITATASEMPIPLIVRFQVFLLSSEIKQVSKMQILMYLPSFLSMPPSRINLSSLNSKYLEILKENNVPRFKIQDSRIFSQSKANYILINIKSI